ncbi:ferm domain (protein4.1-ezrin-radixin-moesin) family [Holotrichia oblita]|uniref:Ferm domain (Protein4.1-ezrin-radixin-moesin) family n=1 Tax=Holotrichia oblita TaxID=644536 RepID=A0ACB9T1B9_HOLOL|nr:ferm domain (protein4.1-ezrin-radixin-moesin) family [Holotrichia oblita]
MEEDEDEEEEAHSERASWPRALLECGRGDGEYLFAEPDSKLSKYAPKSWKSSHSHGLDANGRPALAFYFRVQFYVDSPLLLRDDTTRHHYYLQLRLNASSGAAGDHATGLAGLALQADLGDRSESTVFRPEDYVPPGMREPAALRAIEAAHRTHRNVSKTEARAHFIAEACQLQAPVNAHVFRLRASKAEIAPGSIMLAVCATGLRVCPDNNPPSTFLWSSIAKLSFERKKFEIRTNHEKLTLYTTSDEKSRLLLALCKAAHQFSMAVAPRLHEAKREEEERRQRWDCDQRVSVISSTSSNTTSGIVSDRVHSEDELEIMITSPPAPSTESLALAHLLDSAPASSRTSAASATAALAALTFKDEESESSKHDTSESSAKTTASVKCAGSQCSSSCSTVVVTPIQAKAKRRPSTSSSLELGYSHTAQNSAVSDATCVELDDIREPVYTVGTAAPSSHTSGVYTLSSSDQYATSSEQFPTADQVDGLTFRVRSNSNVSNSGSFRGDGSDPTDTKQALLTAEELSDLIVGRYPSCKSVSHTLDSDSDYVTLPSSYEGYAPIPPKRIDSEVLCMRDPPPYPENPTPVPPPVYPSEEVAARFITTRPPSILTAHTSVVSGSSTPSYSSPNQSQVPPIPPKLPRSSSTIISPNNYIDVAATKAGVLFPCTFLPPPPQAPRQPPPPPPMATVYTSQLSRSQIEQYQQQMYSDVDFVVFPLKEPAISRQEYLEAKQGSLLAALAHTQPMLYRSTPYLPRYASSQNLSDTYVQLPVYGAPKTPQNPPKFRRLPPPPPPLPEKRSELRTLKIDKNAATVGDDAAAKAAVALDIRTLREKSKKMDLPLISALCNDRSLIKQTKAFVMPKHPQELAPRLTPSSSTKAKYPVSGLSSTRINKPARKTQPSSHRHPGDKLPEIPRDTTTQKMTEIPRATPNNYVLTDPRAKHKTVQSQS